VTRRRAGARRTIRLTRPETLGQTKPSIFRKVWTSAFTDTQGGTRWFQQAERRSGEALVERRTNGLRSAAPGPTLPTEGTYSTAMRDFQDRVVFFCCCSGFKPQAWEA